MHTAKLLTQGQRIHFGAHSSLICGFSPIVIETSRRKRHVARISQFPSGNLRGKLPA
jgi:hypothetical protein